MVKNKKHIKICWCCDSCNRLVISDSREHHTMDNCTCGACGVDLEYYSYRMAGNPRVIARFKEGDKWRYVR